MDNQKHGQLSYICSYFPGPKGLCKSYLQISDGIQKYFQFRCNYFIQCIYYKFLVLIKLEMSDKDNRRKIVLKNYAMKKKLGEGAFGQIFLATNINDNSDVALKIENALSKRSQLLYESKFISQLIKTKKIGEQINIPQVYNIGREGNSYVMVMDYLGPSLEEMLNLCGRKFSIKTTIMIGLQMLKLIQFIHSRGVLHRDIKPDNFLIGRGKNNDKIYMIDFGLAKKYLNKDNQTHIPYRDNKDLTGTARYASVNTHLGIEQGRRDDIQSLVYVLLYFLRGSLPWQSMKGQGKKQKYQKIMEKKLTFSIPFLTQGLPKEFQEMLSYVRCLYFSDTPNYEFLRQLLNNIAKRQKLNLAQKDYDWIRHSNPNITHQEKQQMKQQSIKCKNDN